MNSSRPSSAATRRDWLSSSTTTSRCGGRRDDDKQRALKVLRSVIGGAAERSYEILDRQLFPDGFVQQHVLHATGTNGGSIAFRVCLVINSSVSSGSQA